MKKSIRFALFVLTLTLLLTGCAAKEEPVQETPVQESAVGILSGFTATDLDGNEVTAESALSGYDLVMVNVWGTFCGPCIKEMPDLGALSEELAERNIRVVGIVTDAIGSNGQIDATIVETAKEIVKQTGADYLHILPSEDLYGLLYQITAVPTTFFVDENGCQVGTAYAGARDKDEWLQLVEETLAGK